jgi:hypothetical protein
METTNQMDTTKLKNLVEQFFRIITTHNPKVFSFFIKYKEGKITVGRFGKMGNYVACYYDGITRHIYDSQMVELIEHFKDFFMELRSLSYNYYIHYNKLKKKIEVCRLGTQIKGNELMIVDISSP